MPVLHPAYRVVAQAERCWSKDEKQAQERAKVIVAKLAEAGILSDGEMRGGLFVRGDQHDGSHRHQ